MATYATPDRIAAVPASVLDAPSVDKRGSRRHELSLLRPVWSSPTGRLRRGFVVSAAPNIVSIAYANAAETRLSKVVSTAVRGETHSARKICTYTYGWDTIILVSLPSPPRSLTWEVLGRVV